LAFSPDGTVLASAGGNTKDFIIRLWDVEDGSMLGKLEGHTGIVWNVVFSPDGQMLASVSNDSTCVVWDWRTGSIIKTISLPDAITSVAFSPDGQTLALGGVESWPDAAIWTFAVPSWQPQMKLQEYWNIPAIVYTPDGAYIVAGGISRNVRIWRSSDGEHLFTLYHGSQVSSLAMSPGGATVAAGLAEGAVWLWDVETGRLINKIHDLGEWVENVAYSIDGSLLIAGSRNGMLQFYASSDYQHIFTTLTPDGNGIFALSPDGRVIAAAGRNGLIHLWRVQP
jgi:WD40 repeat protein